MTSPTESAPDTAPAARGAARPLWKNPFLIAFVLGAVFLTVQPFIQDKMLRAPPPLAQLGDWSLTDENGQAFGDDQLAGKVWIASFFFTRCPSVCPAQQESMKKILAHVPDDVVLVSFTVDPDHDKPEVLRAYAAKLGAPEGRWKWLGGSQEQMKDILVKRFLVAMGEPDKATDGSLGDIAHANKFALVDQNGALRDFWSTDDEGRGNIINAALLLHRKGPNP